VGGPNNTQLPIAQPIGNHGDVLIASAIPVMTTNDEKSYATTTTTVYAPDGTMQPPLKQSQITKTTTITTLPKATIQSPTIVRRIPIILRPCPHCQNTARTQTRTHPNCITWIAVITLLILFWPICWIPLVCDSWKQTDHYCSHCSVKVGEITPFQDCCEKRRG
jgi:hypothetical protein